MREIAPRIYLMDKFKISSGITVELLNPKTFLVYNLDTNKKRYFAKDIFIPGNYETREQAISLFREKMSDFDEMPIYINHSALSLIDNTIAFYNPQWKFVKEFPEHSHQIQLYTTDQENFVIANTDNNKYAVVSRFDFSSCYKLNGETILDELLEKVEYDHQQMCYMTYSVARLINKVIDENLNLPFRS